MTAQPKAKLMRALRAKRKRAGWSSMQCRVHNMDRGELREFAEKLRKAREAM